ncbi:hypothetical protein BDZ45DRAFT_147356 [Acephala macrosclerotiorum]|nr:hypothetical protein BDZ45DRAFT_147356 [Acephala macrosclerotiorum]
MSLPSDFTPLLPAWSACVMGFLGVFDPPVALTQQSGLSPKDHINTANSSYHNSPSTASTDSHSTTLDTTAQSETTNPPPVSSSSSNIVVIIGSSSIADSGIPPSSHPITAPILQPITPTAVIIGTQTITAANQQTSISPLPPTTNCQTITANAQGNYVVGTQTITPGSSSITILKPPIVIAGQTVAANSQGNYVVGTQTLVPGRSAITVSET